MRMFFAIQPGNIMLALLIKSCFAPLIWLQRICHRLVVCMYILCEFDYLYICRYVFWRQLSFFMVEIVMLSKITLCKLLVVVIAFLLLSVWGFDANSAKSIVCESLSDNSFDAVCKDLAILFGSSTPSQWLMFFVTVVLDKVRLVYLDTLFTALFVPCSVSAALLILILLVGIMVF